MINHAISVTIKSTSHYILFPFVGLCLFILLYILATCFYPGGNEIDTTAKGFSWQHNYWCELMATRAENGELNKGRPIAISAMIILAISLAAIWIYIPRVLYLPAFGTNLIRYAGILSMAALFFLFVGAKSHDTVLNYIRGTGHSCLGHYISRFM